MKKSEIRVGGCYIAKINNKLTTVRVDTLREQSHNSRTTTVYDVTNLTTGRSTTFRSAARFRRPAARHGSATPSLSQTLSQRLAKRHDDSPQRHDHIVVRAYAGTGKTFTQIVGVAWAYGQSVWPEIQAGIAGMVGIDPEEFEITPSDEQQAVWDAFAESKGETTSIVYCAFNKSIVTEFSVQWGWLVQLLQSVGVNLRFATINSLGSQAVYQHYGRMRIDKDNVEKVIARLLNEDIWDLRRGQQTLLKATVKLVDMAKLTLAGWDEKHGFSPQEVTDDVLDRLCSQYDIETNGARERVYPLVRDVLQECMEPKSFIDFNDQNWLPIINDQSVAKADLVLVDEGQDLNRCKQEFCRRIAGTRGRMVLVGDVNQAIYGFAGADVDSIPRMEQLLGVTKPLTLSETRRCCQAVVREAQQIVPGFRAHPDNPEGLVRTLSVDKYTKEVTDGDMVLCRVNAPLVSQALRLIKDGRKAVIRGRDFGTTLQNFVKRIKATTIEGLLSAVDKWVSKESVKEGRKKFPSEARILAIQDRGDCIHAFAEDAETIEDIITKMTLVFAGKVCPKCGKHYGEETAKCYTCKAMLVTPQGVLFSSVHKAKGLEANRVFIFLKDAPMPHPMAKLSWERQQEVNLKYVAITRAKRELVYVN